MKSDLDTMRSMLERAGITYTEFKPDRQNRIVISVPQSKADIGYDSFGALLRFDASGALEAVGGDE